MIQTVTLEVVPVHMRQQMHDGGAERLGLGTRLPVGRSASAEEFGARSVI